METAETKKGRLLKTPSIFNFARQNHPRFDDTLAEIWRMVEHPPKRSLQPIISLCERLANREKTYDQVWQDAEKYQGYLRMAADEVLPQFDQFLTVRQIEVIPNFIKKPIQYPFARTADGKVRAIPIKPTFVAVEGDKLVPHFALFWANPRFKYSQVELICSILRDSLLSQEDYRGSDAKIVLVKRGKWENLREIETWRVSSYANLGRADIERQFTLYNRAIAEALNLIESLKD